MAARIDEGKITRLLEIMARNIEIEIQAEEDAAPKIAGIYICGASRGTKAKIDRSLENELLAALSPTERKELKIAFAKRRRRKLWRAGDQLRKLLWGGW
jgi:hypothetical protein